VNVRDFLRWFRWTQQQRIAGSFRYLARVERMAKEKALISGN